MGTVFSCCTTPGGRENIRTRRDSANRSSRPLRSFTWFDRMRARFASKSESIGELDQPFVYFLILKFSFFAIVSSRAAKIHGAVKIVIPSAANDNRTLGTTIGAGKRGKLVYEHYLCECSSCPRTRLVEELLEAYVVTTGGTTRTRKESLRRLLHAFSTYNESIDVNLELVTRAKDLLDSNNGDIGMSFLDLIR